ncbi:MAG: S1 RNA-binding domain-containing protein [Bacilli bacterium]
MSNFKIGDIVKGQVTGITSYGVFVSLEDDYTGLVHISEVSDGFVKDLNDNFKIGDIINVKVLDIDEDKSHVKLSIKKVIFKVKNFYTKLVEEGEGFKPLEEKLKGWTKEILIEKKKR